MHYSERKSEIEELALLFQLRADAEVSYAQNLYKIADRNPENSIKIGLLGKEVESFK